MLRTPRCETVVGGAPTDRKTAELYPPEGVDFRAALLFNVTLKQRPHGSRRRTAGKVPPSCDSRDAHERPPASFAPRSDSG